MATIPSVSISVILRTVWNDLGEIFVRLRAQSLIALSLVLVLELIGSTQAISGNPGFSEAFELMGTIAILPFEIAIYRLLILDEAASGYPFAISTARFQRVLGWTVAFWVIGNIPIYLPGAIASSDAANSVFSIVLIIADIAIVVRLAILLPAIAVDAPDASVGNALADSRGHVWFIMKAYLLVLLPVVVMVMLTAVLAWLAGGADVFGRSGREGVGVNAVFASLAFLASIGLMIVQARLFMRIGDRVKGDAESAGD